ncbi:5'-nucleotidase, C-terminal domain-containing protein [Besnoitia besnoiti]|uniref:5'-nucleotidase, C-terminal domain-containing protein n=1 Tax=Besnoitia besnoiti TaxID=94643 RepID=A0A2A9MAT8_BESBE|nr:5'-nucleotidase, C-terminal domain-containing protein [Besnoitia besnoiti]PFH33046.1 5'-nucleotidase, C-terminal domain-containing protein [Besnoitia besnoiti]
MAPQVPASPDVAAAAGASALLNAMLVGKKVPLASSVDRDSKAKGKRETPDELEQEVALLVSAIARQASKGYTGETWYDFDLPLDRTDPITIIHFNDVYNIECRTDGSGGVSRFVTALQQYQHLHPLILFSGDVFNPSVMSTYTRGRHMIPFLNLLKIHTACFGNHDFDFGIDELEYAVGSCNFPWLISNVFEKTGQERTSASLTSLRTMRDFGNPAASPSAEGEEASQTRDGLDGDGPSGDFAEDFIEVHGLPLANGMKYRLFEWQGLRVGIIGLVEREWLDTLACVGKDDVVYVDFVEAANCLCRILRQKECELIIALTHMRAPNDERLAKEAIDIDLILGGHDHDYYGLQRIGNIPVVKSGTDFREFTVLTIYPGRESQSDDGSTSSARSPCSGAAKALAHRSSPKAHKAAEPAAAAAGASPPLVCEGVGLLREKTEKKDDEPCAAAGMCIKIRKAASDNEMAKSHGADDADSTSPCVAECAATSASASSSSSSSSSSMAALSASQVRSPPSGACSPTGASSCATAGRGSPLSSLSAPFSPESPPSTPRSPRSMSPTFVSEEASRREANASPDSFNGPLLPTALQGGEEVMPFFLGGSLVRWSRVSVDPARFEKNKHVELLVKKYEQNLKKQMRKVLVDARCDLETRFAVIRTSESNVGNWLCDIMRRECKADIAILNSGTIRSDCVFHPGPFRFGDLAEMLPMADTLCVIAVPGAMLLDVLENSVSQLPKTEGRFLQVAGLRFAFDSSRAVGRRLLRDSVTVAADACGDLRSGTATPLLPGTRRQDDYLPLDETRIYSVATKTYVAAGRDGYDMLATCKVLVEDELLPPLPTMVRSALTMAELANGLKRPHSRITFRKLATFTSMQQEDMLKDFGCCVTSELGYVLAPQVDGRIVDVAKTKK